MNATREGFGELFAAHYVRLKTSENAWVSLCSSPHKRK